MTPSGISASVLSLLPELLVPIIIDGDLGLDAVELTLLKPPEDMLGAVAADSRC